MENAPSIAEQLIPGSVGLALCATGSFFFTRALLRAFTARRWPTVEGEVTQSQTRSPRRGAGSTAATAGRRTYVTYRYTVGAEHLEGRRVSFGEAWDASVSTATRLAKRYPVGARVAVRYDPRRPSSAVLEPTAGWLAWVGALGCTGLFVTLLVELARVLR